jgi:SAM-dependent methyltransferase
MKVETNPNAVRQDKTGVDASVSDDRRGFWDGRAREFSSYSASTGYPDAFIKIMRPRKTWTVLDMACGGGTIAIPLAKRVRKITAVDFSRNMLDILENRCREKGILNVETIHGRWEDDWSSLGIGPHDIAIASRSLLSDDVRGCIEKLRRIAQKAVYLSTVVGSGPFDQRLFEVTGRKFETGYDYIYYYNLLYEMGLRVNLVFIPENHRNEWGTLREALDGQRWMFRGGWTEEEEQRVQVYLKQNLVRTRGRWRLPYQRQCVWAVMWWINED